MEAWGRCQTHKSWYLGGFSRDPQVLECHRTQGPGGEELLEGKVASEVATRMEECLTWLVSVTTLGKVGMESRLQFLPYCHSTRVSLSGALPLLLHVPRASQVCHVRVPVTD